MAGKTTKDIVCRRFGENLRTARAVAGLSQEELADLSGFDRTYISSAERGKRNVSLSAIVQLCNALCVPVSVLLAGLTEAEDV